VYCIIFAFSPTELYSMHGRTLDMKATCVIGYNDFDLFFDKTLLPTDQKWTPMWPNVILRHVHKETFFVFLSRFVRVLLLSLQNVQIGAKAILLVNIPYGYKKAEFYADFISVENIAKKFTKSCMPKTFAVSNKSKKLKYFNFSFSLITFYAWTFCN
jgi:hypothetical protein